MDKRILVFILNSLFTLAYAGDEGCYRKDVCLCNLDSYLKEVHTALMEGESVQYDPTTETLKTATVDNASNDTDSSNETTSSDNTTISASSLILESLENGTYQISSNSSFKLDSNGLISVVVQLENGTEISLGSMNASELTSESNDTIQIEIGDGSNITMIPVNASLFVEYEDSLLSKIAPPIAPSSYFDTSSDVHKYVTISDVIYKCGTNLEKTVLTGGYGVLFNGSYYSENCSCSIGNVVTQTLCLSNVKYDSKYENNNDLEAQAVAKDILTWIDIKLSATVVLNGTYIYTRFVAFRNFVDNLQIVVDVYLNDRIVSPEYNVLSALEVELREKLFMHYTTDTGNKGCFRSKDITNPLPKEDRLKEGKYILGGVAAAILVVLVIFSCLGKHDSFYMRFW